MIRCKWLIFNDDTMAWRRCTFHYPFVTEIQQSLVDSLMVSCNMRWLDVFFDFSLNKLLYKQSICRSFETPWNTCDVTVIWNATTDADSESVHNDKSLTLCRKLFKMLTCFNVNGFCSGCCQMTYPFFLRLSQWRKYSISQILAEQLCIYVTTF